MTLLVQDLTLLVIRLDLTGAVSRERKRLRERLRQDKRLGRAVEKIEEVILLK